jgi:glycosyltransferase involved in cell wall biosynthesis
MRRILRRLARTDRIVCVSERTREDLLQLARLDAARVVTIPNAVFQQMGAASDDACTLARSELGLPADAPLVLHVGRNFYKNRKAVLEIFTRIAAVRDDVRLVLVGSLSQDLVALAETLGIAPRVHVLRHVVADRMAALYTTSALLLFPSLYEGFGYPVLEAQLCGTPVVCSDAGSLGEVAGDGARVFAPEDIDGMTKAALDVLEYPEIAADLVARGQANAKRYTRRRWFAAHQALYRELT